MSGEGSGAGDRGLFTVPEGLRNAKEKEIPTGEGGQDGPKSADQAQVIDVPAELRGKTSSKPSVSDAGAHDVPPKLVALRGSYEKKADQAQMLEVPASMQGKKENPASKRGLYDVPKEILKGNADAILAARKVAEKAAVGPSEKVVVDAGLQRETTQSTRNREMTGVIEQPKPKTEEKTEPEPEPGLLKKLWNKIF